MLKRRLRKRKGNVSESFNRIAVAIILTIFPHRKYIVLHYLFFVAYFTLLCWLLAKSSFIRHAGIDKRVMLGLFTCKVLAGIAIGWFSLHWYGPGNDYWDNNKEAWTEYQLLLQHPKAYFTNLFSSGYAEGYSGVFNSSDSFWNDLRNNIIIKLVSLFNIFSQGNYYINSLFFNWIVFFGHVALYRVFSKVFPGKNTMLIIGCFLLPSFLYFSSGLHKDGVVFLLLAFLCYIVYGMLERQRVSWKPVLALLFCLAMTFLLRNFVLIALLPGLVAWFIAAMSKNRVWLVFAVTFLFFAVLLFNIHYLLPSVDPLATIIQRQADYLQLPTAATDIPLNRLEPGFGSFIANTPQAMSHLLLRPYLWDTPVRSLLPFAVELFLYQLLFIRFLLGKKMRFTNRNDQAFIYFCIFFSLVAFLFIGFIVPNIGSLVRYRSIYLPFIIVPLLGSISWKMKGSRLNNKIS